MKKLLLLVVTAVAVAALLIFSEKAEAEATKVYHFEINGVPHVAYYKADGTLFFGEVTAEYYARFKKQSPQKTDAFPKKEAIRTKKGSRGQDTVAPQAPMKKEMPAPVQKPAPAPVEKSPATPQKSDNSGQAVKQYEAAKKTANNANVENSTNNPRTNITPFKTIPQARVDTPVNMPAENIGVSQETPLAKTQKPACLIGAIPSGNITGYKAEAQTILVPAKTAKDRADTAREMKQLPQKPDNSEKCRSKKDDLVKNRIIYTVYIQWPQKSPSGDWVDVGHQLTWVNPASGFIEWAEKPLQSTIQWTKSEDGTIFAASGYGRYGYCPAGYKEIKRRMP